MVTDKLARAEQIGAAGFRQLLAVPEPRRGPGILKTPKGENFAEGCRWGRRNLRSLRKLAEDHGQSICRGDDVLTISRLAPVAFCLYIARTSDRRRDGCFSSTNFRADSGTTQKGACKMSEKLNWGLLATGNIANALANGIQRSRTGRLLAAASRSLEKAQDFAKKYDIPRAYGSYEELLADPEVEAVYISTPHSFHAEWAVKAAEAGKHILCEKPLALNAAEAMAVVEAARQNRVFLLEAFMYRCHPLTDKLLELVRDRAVGELRMIRASFSFQAGFNPEGRLFNNRLAGGGILDVGCYPVSMSRLVAGAALGRPFADPLRVVGAGHLLPETGVDAYAAAVLQFENGILAQVSAGVRLNQENDLTLYCDDGRIRVDTPWFGSGREGGRAVIEILPQNGAPREEVVETDQWLYTFEADTVGLAVLDRQLQASAMTWDDSLGNMRTLDAWRRETGLEYESEKIEFPFPTITRRPLAKAADAPMTYGRLPGLDLPVSRLVYGCDKQSSMPHAAVAFDDFFQRGGNTFDTAYIYGGGLPERLLGAWIRQREVRDQVNVMVKGAHTPECRPEAAGEQLAVSLERLQIECADLYLLHRDNPRVPVGEFVEALNEQGRAGRLRLFGVSNWSVERIEAANAYAAERGLRGIAAVSNNFSLARMVEPVWAGCVAASEPG